MTAVSKSLTSLSGKSEQSVSSIWFTLAKKRTSNSLFFIRPVNSDRQKILEIKNRCNVLRQKYGFNDKLYELLKYAQK